MNSVGIIFINISNEDVALKREDRDRYLEVISEKIKELWVLYDDNNIQKMEFLRKEIEFLQIAVSELTSLLENHGF
jgi:hypothetical protein